MLIEFASQSCESQIKVTVLPVMHVTHTRVCVYIRTYTYTYMHVYICMCAYTCVLMPALPPKSCMYMFLPNKHTSVYYQHVQGTPVSPTPTPPASVLS